MSEEFEELILDDFEHGDLSKYEMNHYFVNTYGISLSDEQAKYGKSSLKVSFNYGGWLSGNGAMFIKFKDNLSTEIMPVKLSVWVYSDGKTPWLRATFIDGLGETKQANLTSENISWHGWKYLDVAIDPSWELPLKLEQIYAVEVDKDYQGDSSYQGTFYLDQLRFVFLDNEDLSGPTFSNLYPERDIVYEDTFNFSATVTDDMSGVDSNSIIVKVNNEIVNHFYCKESGKISYLFEQVKQGRYHVTIEAMDNAGNKSIPHIDRVITVDLSPDVEKPVLSNVTPTKTAIEYTNTPRITFHIVDEKSGIDTKDILVTINNEEQEVTYDGETGWGYAVSKTELTSGKHHFAITAKDRSGNTLGPIQHQFTIKTIKQPKNMNDFKISVIPDTHSYEYGKIGLYSANNKGTDFIIQMGDMVDQATEEEYANVRENLKMLGDKSILTIPGNHEAFQGNLDSFMNLFGSPTYHLTYGNALFIFLNTAYEQSITMSDSTQFHYLENVLAENKLENVVIMTHVPTKDRFGTLHEMQTEDALRLEDILCTYKQKNPSIHITVLFGHLHVIDHWQVEGVNYIITGNSASKGYVTNKHGNILGHGVLHMTPYGITYEFIPYVNKVSMVNNNELIDDLRLIKGTSTQIQVQTEIKKLFSNYIIDITDFDLVRKKWSTTNENVVSVNKRGIIEAIESGSATIMVEVSGKQAKVKVVVKEE